MSFEVSKDTLKSRSDCRRFGLGSLLFFLFCFSVLVLGRTGKEKVCDKTNAPWDTEWDLRSSHWPNHRLKTPSLPFYRFISSVFRFSSFIPKNALIKGYKDFKTQYVFSGPSFKILYFLTSYTNDGFKVDSLRKRTVPKSKSGRS